jgi:hypothetical protein
VAEGLVGGILGGEEEKPEVEAPEALASAEAFAAAVAAIASRQDPQVARDTSTFLSKQAHLLDIQATHLQDEHPLRLANLRHQSRLLRGQRVAQALRIGFQVFVALAVTFIGVGVIAMIRDAVTSRGVVIEAFSVPPDLTQRGLTGQVIAQQVLDQLSDMQAKASSWSARPANSYTNNWSSNFKVEVPTTGVSFGELRRYLREALGHETHISGEVYATRAGFTVTARAGDKSGTSFTGRDEDLGNLVRQAAESVYEQTQPYRYAGFLFVSGRRDEALRIFKRLEQDPSTLERAWAHVAMGADARNHDKDFATAAAEERAALTELPGLQRATEMLTQM